MRGQTHTVLGLTTLALVEHVYPFIQPHPIGGLPAGVAICAGTAVLGALAPDIDTVDSTINRELGLAGSVTSVGLSVLGIKHRGLTHYALTTLLVMGLSYTIGVRLGWPDAGLAFGLGYLSHFLTDGLTQYGVPLWPGRKIHLLPRPLRIRTGSPVESLLALAGLLVLGHLLPGLIPPAWWQIFERLI